MTAKKRINTAAFYIVAIALAVLAMVPFLWRIATSFKSRGALMSIPIEWLPKEPTWDAYIKVFSKFPFARTIANSLFISVSYTAITLFSASLAAFAFAKIRFFGGRLLLSVYLAMMMIPTQVTMIPQRLPGRRPDRRGRHLPGVPEDRPAPVYPQPGHAVHHHLHGVLERLPVAPADAQR